MLRITMAAAKKMIASPRLPATMSRHVIVTELVARGPVPVFGKPVTTAGVTLTGGTSPDVKVLSLVGVEWVGVAVFR